MDKRKVIFGLILIFLGLIFLGQTTDLFWFDLSDLSEYFLPLLFIGLGIWLIVRKRNQPHPPPTPPGGQTSRQHQTYAPPPPPGQQTTDSQSAGSSATGAQATWQAGPPPSSDQPSVDPTGRLKYDKFLGDLHINFDRMAVTTVEVSSFIGDIDMRLHGAQLSPGLNRIVISGFVGDVRVLIPHDMPIFVHGANFVNDIDILGQHVSGFSNTLDAQSETYSSAESKIYLAINTFIGDIRVYKV